MTMSAAARTSESVGWEAILASTSAACHSPLQRSFPPHRPGCMDDRQRAPARLGNLQNRNLDREGPGRVFNPAFDPTDNAGMSDLLESRKLARIGEYHLCQRRSIDFASSDGPGPARSHGFDDFRFDQHFLAHVVSVDDRPAQPGKNTDDCGFAASDTARDYHPLVGSHPCPS